MSSMSSGMPAMRRTPRGVRQPPRSRKPIRNAERFLPNRTRPEHKKIRSVTDGGKRLVVIVEAVRSGVRPINAWEDR